MTMKILRQAYLVGLPCGLKLSAGRRPRFDLVHSGNEYEFFSRM